MGVRFAPWSVLLAGSLVACSTTTTRIRGQFAKEYACDEAKVFVTNRGDVYEASGCGKHAQYVCPGPNADCSERGQVKQAQSGPNPPPKTYPQERGAGQPHIEE